MIPLESVPCDLCGSTDHARLLVGRDYRFGLTGSYNLVCCTSCRFIFLNPRPTQEALLQLYEDVYPVKANAPLEVVQPRWQLLRKIWHWISGNYSDQVIRRVTGRVLDIGCGYGKLLLPLKRKGAEVYGLEINPRCVEACREAGLIVFAGTLEEACLPSGFFDCVILSQVIEHLPSPKRALREIHRILRQAGRVYLFCPNGDGYLKNVFGRYWHGWHIPFHLYVFTAETITRLAEETGYRVARIRTVTPDDFLTTSLKSDFYGSIERGKFFDSLVFRAVASPLLRFLDLVLKGKGDCLDVELVKT